MSLTVQRAEMPQAQIIACPVCTYALPAAPEDRGLDWTNFNCPVCGEYALNLRAISNLSHDLRDNQRARAWLSHVIRKRQGNRRPSLDWTQVEDLLNNESLPKPREQLDLLIYWIAKNQNGYGRTVSFRFDEIKAVIGGTDVFSAQYIVRSALEKGLVEGPLAQQGGDLLLSLEGWDRFDEQERIRVHSRVGFMAMQYGNEVLDRVVNGHFRPAVAQTGFQLTRLDDLDRQQAGLIDNRLRVEIMNARFLIVDLTLSNRGAYWEAGYAEGLGKPVIYTCNENFFNGTEPYTEEGGTHFDTNHHLTILWTEKTIERASNELKATIRATLPTEARMTDDPA